MRRIPEITQDNVHIFIPYKVAAIVRRLNADRNMQLNRAVTAFYNSRTYANLEDESTKCWHESPAQLYEDFINNYQQPRL